MRAQRWRRILALAMVAALAILATWLVQGNGGGEDTHRRVSPGAPHHHHGHPRSLAAELDVKLPAPRSGEAVAVANGQLLVIGGLDAADVSTDEVLAIDPQTDRVQAAGSLAEPLHDLAGITAAGRTIVLGGGSATTSDLVQRLVPDGAAQIIGHLPAPASDLAATSLSNRGFVVGGFDGQAAIGSVLEVGAAGRLRKVAELPTPVRYAAVAASGGEIFSFGGELSSGRDTDVIQQIDPRTGRARVSGRIPETLAHASAINLGGRIFLLGGRGAGVPSARIWAFDPTDGRVSEAGRLPFPVTNAAAAALAGVGYLVGGLDERGRALSTVIRLR